MEKTEKITRTKAIMVTLIIHFALLYGLLYVNSGSTKDFVPDFVKEWVKNPTEEATVASTRKP